MRAKVLKNLKIQRRNERQGHLPRGIVPGEVTQLCPGPIQVVNLFVREHGVVAVFHLKGLQGRILFNPSS
jgi:hypothetical protein